MKYLILKSAARRIEEIYAYTKNEWSEKQAEKYITGLFIYFETISERRTVWRLIPAKYGVKGYYGRYEMHFVYWRELPSGKIGIASILHQTMDHIHRLDEDFK